MPKGRLEAFTDGVIAILITILVLDLHAPLGDQVQNLVKLQEPFIVYIISFIAIAIYWNNHHNLLQASEFVSSKVLWANIFLLFWMSLIPFATSWVGDYIYSTVPEILYSFIMLMTSVAFFLFNLSLNSIHDEHSLIVRATKGNNKIYVSMVLYTVGCFLALIIPISGIIFSFIATLIWFVPNRKIEKCIKKDESVY